MGEYEQKSYGEFETLQGAINFIPFRYQGQYEDIETGLYYNRFRYYSPDEECYISQDPIRLAGDILNFYSYVHETNYWIDPNGLHFASGAGQHTATVNVYNQNGSLASSQVLTSGNMTPAEKALGFPQSSLATHTEARATSGIPLSKGQRMEIIGQYPPCNSCKGKMRAATKGGAAIEYKWVDANGKSQIVRWENNKKVVDSTSKNSKLHPKHH